MNETGSSNPLSATRRDFLKTGTALVGGSLVGQLGLTSIAHAAGSGVIKIGLVGCGGRGTGAASQALAAGKDIHLVAMGDAFSDRLEQSLHSLNGLMHDSGGNARIDVPPERRFVGIDAYKHVIEACDVVLLCTPPHFRPAQLKAAIEAGKHVFAEKPVAVDAPGVRSVIETCRQAEEKRLAVVSGLCWRYDPGMRATFERIHSGIVGDIVAMQTSYDTHGLWNHPRQPAWSDMEWQVRNWLYFTWLSGDFNVEQHVHSLDKTAWAMRDQYPVACSGTGGRQTRTGHEYGNIFDHMAVVYEYDNGVKTFSRCRQQDGCALDVSDHIFGTKGRVDVMTHTAFDHDGKEIWRYHGPKKNMYQVEHDALFASIRDGKPINNGHYMANSTMMGILGRMVAYTGLRITWEKAINSKLSLSPPNYDWGPIEVAPVAMPGITPFV
jgi:myo-inositol 2-dehydrogenase/D-chiro-inositol 1-dehydrogenase